MPNTHHYQTIFAIDGLEPGVLRATRLRIEERVSEEAWCELALVCDVGVIEPRAILGKMVLVAIVRDGNGAVVRRFRGMVRSASEKATTVEGRQVLKVVAVSPLAALADASDSRLFLEKTTKEIVGEVLSTCGIPDDMIEWRLASVSPMRETCAQYRETMRAFVDRLLEEDGVYWYEIHGEDGLKLVFSDDPSGFEKLEGPEIPYKDWLGGNSDEALLEVGVLARVRPKKVTLREHDFTKPALDLECVVEVDAALGREHYEYPGRYADKAGGSSRASAISAAQIADAQQIHIRGHAPRIVAGHTFDIAGTPLAVHDGAHVAIQVVHEWENGDEHVAPRLSTEAWILPEGVRFAPLPRTKRPSAHGDLAAVTVPPGEEIHCDEYGRIKVQYHWDRRGQQDDKSSGWHRHAQMHTSGSVVISRNTWEVMIEFEDGDPARPVVMGRLYNGAAPPAVALPGGKTNSVLKSYSSPGGGGHNEIRMDDGGGAELVNAHAQKDMNLVVANNKDEKVKTSANVAIGVDQSVTIGASQTEKVGAADTLTVGGNQTYKVGAARTKTVSGSEKHEVKGDRSVSIGATHTTMTPLAYSVTTHGSLSETVGGLCLEAAALGVSLAVAGSASVTVGAAKVEAVATGKTDFTIGARATTIGGAFLNVTPKDISFTTKGAKVTTVGGAWLGNAGDKAEISSSADISITVGGAILANSASIVLKVGGSSVTLSAGSVVLDSSEIKFTASGPCADLSAAVGSK